MGKALTIGAALLLSSLLAASADARSARVPVLVGGDPDLDACSSVGKIVGLDPNGDNFLSVRSGPGSKYDELDRLHTGDLVYLCDEHGAWQGVVYPAEGCGVTTSVPNQQPYTGPCRSGWIFGKYVVVVAG